LQEIEKILTTKAKIINKILAQIMDMKDVVSGTLLSAMKYTLFSGGKRIRPVLTILVAEMVKGNLEAARSAGAVI
jgi:geranylgeranyl diphosphate synthase type II